jgi:hypothetical protein
LSIILSIAPAPETEVSTEFHQNQALSPSAKICQWCSTVKPRSEFHLNARTRDGLSAQCRTCKRDYDHLRAQSGARRRAAWVIRDSAAAERVERLVSAVLDRTGVEMADLVAREATPEVRHARHLIAWIAVRARAAPFRIVGQQLNCSRMEVSRCVGRIDQMRETNSQVRALTDNIRGKFQQ